MTSWPPKGLVRRAAGNATRLLSGKVAAGIMQLATFALAANGLGLSGFGLFSMITAQVTLFTTLAAFDSNQALIRYGVDHLKRDNRTALQALIKAGVVVDLLSASAAAVATLIAAQLIGPRIGWDAATIALAQMAAPLAFAYANATPKGLLRLLGRFDLLSWHTIATPLIRLGGFCLAWALGFSVFGYLMIWMVAGWCGTVVAFFLAGREAVARSLLTGMLRAPIGLPVHNPGLWRFMLASNLNSSLAAMPTHAATFITGAVLGASQAGLVKVAREIGTALMKPTDLINQALYPDIARVVAERDWRRLKRMAVTVGAAAGGVGALTALLALLFGAPLLEAIFGTGYAAAAPVLVLMMCGTAIRALTFVWEPVLYALGRAGAVLAIALVTSCLFLGVLWWRLPIDGLAGAGWAWIGMAAVAALAGPILAHFLIRAEIGAARDSRSAVATING